MRISQIAFIFVFYLLFFYGNNIFADGNTPDDTHYSLFYKAEGDYKYIYDKLVEVDVYSGDNVYIINYAIEIAKKAGYSIITDPSITYNIKSSKRYGYTITTEPSIKYFYNNKKYPLEILLLQNTAYYYVGLIPKTPKTSENLEIIIEKKSRKIISILKGG